MKFEEFKAPYIPYDKIRLSAEDFLGRYNTEDKIPVPIEEIIGYKLDIDILPINNLRDAFGTDGFISKNLKTIYIDSNLYFNDSYEYRYLFTIAHEIGHMFLHRDIYDSLSFSNIDEWVKIIDSIDAKQYSWLDYHANCFAGLILVPEHHLKNEYQNAINIVKSRGFDLGQNKEIFDTYVNRLLQSKFKVSSVTIEKRLKYDNLS